MSECAHLLNAIEAGNPQAAAQLLPLVYDELRQLAAQKLAHEKPGQTLDATALVHEAYLRLVGGGDPPRWKDLLHFCILIDNARKIVDQTGANAGYLVGGDGRSNAATAEGQAPFDISFCHRPCHGHHEIRVVVSRRQRARAEINDLMPGSPKGLRHFHFESKPAVVGGQSDTHEPSPSF